MRTIAVSLKTIRAAIARAEKLSSDWQAQCCEIALIPAIAKRWAELNTNHFQNVHLDRHEGEPHLDYTPEQNHAVKDWSAFAGYVLRYSSDPSISNWGWNSVRSDCYGHSPCTAWDGMRRETVSQFLHDLRMLGLGYRHPELMKSLERAKIRVTGIEATERSAA
jgi:hypothetical protein